MFLNRFWRYSTVTQIGALALCPTLAFTPVGGGVSAAESMPQTINYHSFAD